ncbi:unnamed protein product [Aphanomyces euteiches]
MAVQVPMENAALAMLPEEVSVGFCTIKREGKKNDKKSRTSAMKESSVGLEDPFNDSVTIYDDERQTILSFLTYIRDRSNAKWKDNQTRQPAEVTPECHGTGAVPIVKTLSPPVVEKRATPMDKRKSNSCLDDTSGHSSSSSDSGEMMAKKSKRERQYCICRGKIHGDMIACDNKCCKDRSNWYHMTCVGLEKNPTEPWLCPQCKRSDNVPENLYRKPAMSITYGDMIAAALSATKYGEGTFKEICEFIESNYENQLNWKLESDQRRSPVWKSSVRKILFSNNRFKRHPSLKGVFCLVTTTQSTATPPATA